jgi:hypothetical protein
MTCSLNQCGADQTVYFKNITFHHKRIQRYDDDSCFCSGDCTKCPTCKPDINTYIDTSCSTTIYSDSICEDLFIEWLNVPEPSIQVKIHFVAYDADGDRHFIIWEGNVDFCGNVCFTYGMPLAPWYKQLDGDRIINTYCKTDYGCAGPCYPNDCDCDPDEQHFVKSDT